ncbi:methionine adenosyltransferase 1 [Methylacidimicrobium sp. AP8]|uniref:methionine adenosyltransferase n=1 Tax=Methylacidimicrobium sp. AP8 TaxID=2730359 RepID=UPI0018C0C443|nr:methionine adenosyltransferase [Methylacidimicrobium sp. AP8]CAB4243875.1 methionine adenosyltransferase 1 [Methylacidimicrobium sp. AP8]
MTFRKHVFASESVTEGHPDKVCDAVSDSVLDACLEQDPDSRVACETLVKSNLLVLAGEVTTRAKLDYVRIARERVREIGYDEPAEIFHADKLQIVYALTQQSPDIAQGVDGTHTATPGIQGAGDQGMMFGFACRETPELMPAPIIFAHRLCRRLSELRHRGVVPWLRPDGKAQVSLLYEGYRPIRVETVVVSTQHAREVGQDTIRDVILSEVIAKAIPPDLLDRSTRYFINPTGRFVIGGPEADSGLTGRKIIVDTYGGMGRHGGGAFSGKDPSKVDRSAAYMARYIAKNVVASGAADRAEVQLAYAIGHPDPVSIAVDTFGTGKVDEQKIVDAVRETFRLKPAEIIEELALLRPIYRRTTNYGHFGRVDELDTFTWERTDRAVILQKRLNL